MSLIQVKLVHANKIGGMPSPAHARIPVLIRSTAWFDPLIDEPAYLPNSIFPGETVSIRGEVRAFIRQEGQVRPPGVIFQAVDQLDLVAIMPGINRALPEFFQPVAVSIGYPLELEAPSYLSSVQRGNDVTFSWMVGSNTHGIVYYSDIIVYIRSFGTSVTSHMELKELFDEPEEPVYLKLEIISYLSSPRITRTITAIVALTYQIS